MCEAPRRGSPGSSSRMRPLNANGPRHNRAGLGRAEAFAIKIAQNRNHRTSCPTILRDDPHKILRSPSGKFNVGPRSVLSQPGSKTSRWTETRESGALVGNLFVLVIPSNLLPFRSYPITPPPCAREAALLAHRGSRPCWERTPTSIRFRPAALSTKGMGGRVGGYAVQQRRPSRH
jgi:hypothetical protein